MKDRVKGTAVLLLLITLGAGVLIPAGAQALEFVPQPFRALLILCTGGLIGWAVYRQYVYTEDNPSPTGPLEEAEEEEPLFRVWEDRPGHCVVEWSEGADKLRKPRKPRKGEKE